MYIGCTFDPSKSIPGPSHFNASSTQLLEDAITVKSSSSSVPDGPTTYTLDCPIIYVAVYSYPLYQFTSTSYIINAVPVSGVTTVVPGVSYEGTVYRETTKYYLIYVGDASVEISVLVTPLYGDPDVYIKMDVHDGEVASKTNFDHSSILDQYHDDRVTIGEGQSCTDCDISIAVVGFSQSRFTLIATVEDVDLTLVAGIPFKESVQAYSTQTFTYVSKEDGDLRLFLTLISGTVWMQASDSKNFTTSDTCTAEKAEASPPTCWRDHSSSTGDILACIVSNISSIPPH